MTEDVKYDSSGNEIFEEPFTVSEDPDDLYNTNAKEEFLHVIKDNEVKCAYIIWENWRSGKLKLKKIILKENYTKSEWNKFLGKLDFDYDSGYGFQEISGTIWLTNGDWLSREEYDGSEWWRYNTCPEIPEKCRRTK